LVFVIVTLPRYRREAGGAERVAVVTQKLTVPAWAGGHDVVALYFTDRRNRLSRHRFPKIDFIEAMYAFRLVLATSGSRWRPRYR